MAQNFKILWYVLRIIFSSIVLFSLIHFLLIPSHVLKALRRISSVP